jgi:hypothetical protein
LSQSGGFDLHVTDAFLDFQGLLIEGDRLVYLSLLSIDTSNLMQCGGFGLGKIVGFLDIYIEFTAIIPSMMREH